MVICRTLRRVRRHVWIGGSCLTLAISHLAHASRAGTSPVHPMHTTLTEITVDASGTSLRAIIRVFADDLASATTSRRAGAPPGPHDANAARLPYIQSAFVLTDKSGRRLLLRSCGTRYTADLVWVCVEATLPAGIDGVALRNRLLCDLYDDQINVVRATVRGRLNSMIFTRTDGARAVS